MNLCKCCNTNVANATNTHYLTDSIIRSNFNSDKPIRDFGSIFEISNQTPFITYHFQRSTPTKDIINILNRDPTDEENEIAENTRHFSVDNIFCEDCERKFNLIENEFSNKLRGKIRNNGILEFNSNDEVNLIRRFFLLQYFRTMICDERLEISDDEILRFNSVLFENNDEDLKKIALKVSYLGVIENFEENIVQVDVLNNYPVIFFNDFIIQVFNNEEQMKFIDFYGINNEDLNDFNVNSDKFLFDPLLDEDKVEFFNKYIKPIIEKNCTDLISTDIEMIKTFCKENNVPIFSQHIINDILSELNQPEVFTLIPEKRYKILSQILIKKINETNN